MFSERTIFGYLVGLGFLLGISSGQIELMSNAETEVQKHNLSTTCSSAPLLLCPSAAIAQNIATKTTGVAVAQMPMEMPASSEAETTQFQRIEQPLGLKVAVTTGGIALIGLELWWFLWSKTKSQQAQTNQGIQEVTITVDGGYEPDRIVVSVDRPVRLNFLRCDRSSCLEKILLPDFHITQDLDLDRVTSIEFTPEKPGQYPFTCGMNMYRGIVEVTSSERDNSALLNGHHAVSSR